MFVDCEDADCVAAAVCIDDPGGDGGNGGGPGGGMDEGTSETSCATGVVGQPMALLPLLFALLGLGILRRRALISS